MQRIVFYYAYAALVAALALGEVAAWKTTAMAVLAIVNLGAVAAAWGLIRRAKETPAATTAAAIAMMMQMGLAGALSAFAFALRENPVQAILSTAVLIATIAMLVLVFLPTREERRHPYGY